MIFAVIYYGKRYALLRVERIRPIRKEKELSRIRSAVRFQRHLYGVVLFLRNVNSRAVHVRIIRVRYAYGHRPIFIRGRAHIVRKPDGAGKAADVHGADVLLIRRNFPAEAEIPDMRLIIVISQAGCIHPAACLRISGIINGSVRGFKIGLHGAFQIDVPRLRIFKICNSFLLISGKPVRKSDPIVLHDKPASAAVLIICLHAVGRIVCIYHRSTKCAVSINLRPVIRRTAIGIIYGSRAIRRGIASLS